MITSNRKPIVPDFMRPVAELEGQVEELKKLAPKNDIIINNKIARFQNQLVKLQKEIFSSLTPLQRLHLVRQSERPTTLDYIPGILDEWIELHGDRGGADDPALVGGIGKINGRNIVFIGHQRGRGTKENVARNFGMPAPGGYRKALRLMKHANRFGMPILTFIDTPGAWAGLKAEELGQGEAIAVNLREMFSFEVPIVCTIIGEGGSGGALGIGIGDSILMLEYAIYTVATPEACAAILWKNSKESLAAAEALKITSHDLKVLGIVDEILQEPLGGAQADPYTASQYLKKELTEQLDSLSKLDSQTLKKRRYEKFRRMGAFYEI
uniref:Acetyl-coenzyme A carboxylase carboxyl transferase subunit alpha n=2 Tax=Pyropia yezoensis TaxID=2788 RepID=ACCA_PYRYE|nr:acetyl-CoA carboxylase carboxyltransferase alpha subunit [Neopyropia yezoensis]Q1XDB6.1 RecName: Full=Acetyl-coenzyme A carboxylase carboxyl transferase subunit alpha; Short=ACCase subunit alpha; Short=Acetyl-CoA carboxylase carboxyltransferase subunit alpha [Neopyropia yezoensis]AGH27699.1 acetyl-CoA carboxylase carboxyltransferase alpha subunit [Neopyropia yezoensis]QFZ67035.1 acetyl-CoA carboxylase carboxyltransferase alpha subunit [Neopyropia yezoensis]ULU28998.1 acetyl-CoA carboxylase c